MSDKYNDVLIGHPEEADGIQEYDNSPPAWWWGIFVFTVVWGFFYAVHYHFVGLRSQAGEYDAEVAAAAKQWPEAKVEVLQPTPDVVAAGKALFETNCVGCHAADLTGGIGPNLVDAEWIHGGTLEEINATVFDGVAAKAMPAWGQLLGATKASQAAAFVYAMSHGAGPAAAAKEEHDEEADGGEHDDDEDQDEGDGQEGDDD